MTHRERWFGATGRRVPEIALEGSIDVTGALVLGSVEHQATQREAQRLVDRLERLPRLREPLGEVSGHPDFLRTLSRAEPNRVLRGYHCSTRLAQVKPAPNAQNITFMPGVSRPQRTASSRAIATDAADVLP